MSGSRSNLFRWLAVAALTVNLFVIQGCQWMARLTLRRAFLLNLLTLVVLAAQLPAPRSRPRPLLEGRWPLIALAVVLALGVCTRTLRLDRFPPPDGQLWEETQTGKVAFDSIRDGSLDPYFPLTNLVGEAGLRLFGRSLLGLRLAFVALSVASLPVFLVAARWLLRGSLAALLATGLFAANVYLAAAGRVALETMAPVFTVSLALAWTFRAAAEQSYAGFALAGFANGLLLTEYFGYKLIPPVAFCFLALSVLQPARGAFCNVDTKGYDASRLRSALPLLLLFGVFALAVVAPLFTNDPLHAADYFLEGYRRQQVGIAGETAGLGLSARLGEALGRVGQAASFVFLHGNDNDLLPASMGIVDVATGALGLAALVYCAWRGARCPAKLFLVACAASLTVLSGLLVGNPARYRLTPLVPLVLLAIGVAADDLLALRGRVRNVAAVAVAALAVGVAAWNVHLFFGRIVDDREVRLEFYDLNLLLANEIATLQARDAGAVVYLLSDRDFLGRANDYAFLYDDARVRVVAAGEDVGGPGYVVAHDGFVDQLRHVPRATDCRREQPWLSLSRIVSCRLR
jgi:hypothetical protein